MARATRHLPLVGGPLDGFAIAARPGRYAWVRGKVAHLSSRPISGELRLARGHRGSVLHGGSATSRPTDGAALYERLGDVYIYAGHHMTYCNRCGTYHARVEGGRERRPCALQPDEEPA